MENVVPGTLQRLRAADIIRMAGLTTASLGQEYCRTGLVHSTTRQGASISGTVEAPHPTHSILDEREAPAIARHYTVEVELQSPTSWISRCPCSPGNFTLCSHAAALLYQWLARPAGFTVSSPSLTLPESIVQPSSAIKNQPQRPQQLGTARGPAPLSSLIDILTQLGLSELRSIAREYEITTNGMSKQQLAETILDVLHQPEAVRRIATTLEKNQRQLLAIIVLAGGSINDDDLRGLYERFKLGQLGQLQTMLVALQNKALLFRTSLNSGSHQRIGLSGVLLDIGWHVPAEVKTALRVSVPTTVFASNTQERDTHIEQSEPYLLLTDLLLVARLLDGYHLTEQDEKRERPEWGVATSAFEGSVPLPLPADMPSPSLLAALQPAIQRPPEFLRFAIRLLRLADILHRDDDGTSYLRSLPNVTQLLLGPDRADIARDLFELWLTQSSYEELLYLQEDGVHLRCRATTSSFPLLRAGELDAENSEARQSLVSLLAQIPLNQWVSFPAFSRFAYRLNPLFLQRRQRLFTSPHWWFEIEEGRPLNPLQFSDWSQAELHYLSRLLSGPLYWWGVCDLLYSQDGSLLAFRLTTLAGWLFNSIRPGEEAVNYHMPSNPLEIVGTDEVLVAVSPQTWQTITVMETFAETAGIRNGRLCYRLTPKSLGEAISRGHQLTPLLNLLRHEADMLSRLESWIANYGRVRIYTGVTLLETVDAMVMRELAATTSLGEQIVQTIHPTLLILKKPGLEQVLDDLKRRGQSPLLHEKDV